MIMANLYPPTMVNVDYYFVLDFQGTFGIVREMGNTFPLHQSAHHRSHPWFQLQYCPWASHFQEYSLEHIRQYRLTCRNGWHTLFCPLEHTVNQAN